jgi:hypothetical protein
MSETTDRKLIGKVYGIPPQPPVAENTTYLRAGALTIGVEYRDVNPENLVETYKDNDAYLKELLEKSPEGGFADEGVSIHVCATDGGHEYLRFDVFDDDPHYHYIHAGDEVVNNVIDFDVLAHGEMLPWVIERLRTRLPEMLPHAKGADLVPHIDHALLDPVIDQVEAMASKAQADVRAVRAARDRATERAG